MIGSTMRAAPSTMSSGGWKRCSAVLRSAICDRVLVGHPAGVDAVHVDAVGVVVGRRGARHHVQRGLGHVRVRVRVVLKLPVELPLHRRDVDDVLVALRRAQHQRLEARVEHERRDGVDELHLEQLDRRHLGEQQPPRVALAQVDLLQVLVEPALGEQVACAAERPRAAAAPATARPACVSPTSAAPRSASAGAVAEQVVAAQALVRAEQLRALGRQRRRATPSRAPSCGGRSRAGGARSGRRC